MLKVIILLALSVFVSSRSWNNFDDYCNMMVNRVTCNPNFGDQSNLKWFLCSLKKDGQCVSTIHNFPDARANKDASVSFTNGTHWYHAEESFSSIPNNSPFNINDIKAWKNFKNVQYIDVEYDNAVVVQRYFPGIDINNIRKLPFRTGATYHPMVITRVIIYEKPKSGCILFYASNYFKGDSWEICGGNWYKPNSMSNFNSYIMGHASRLQYWSGFDLGGGPTRMLDSVNTDNLRFLQGVVAPGPPSMGNGFGCQANGPECLTNYEADSPGNFYVTTNASANFDFYIVCTNNDPNSRCWFYTDNGGN